MANPSLTRQFTLTNFVWRLRANGHLKGEKIGAVNYLKLSRIPVDIRLYWNFTNNRDTAFSIDELVRGFKINERDEAGNAKTLDNVWLWSEGGIPIEPLSDVIEIEYNGAGELIEPLLGNKSGSIDKIEKVQVVSAIDKVLQPIKVVSTTNTQGKTIENYYRINANVTRPTIKYAVASIDYEKIDHDSVYQKSGKQYSDEVKIFYYMTQSPIFGYYKNYIFTEGYETGKSTTLENQIFRYAPYSGFQGGTFILSHVYLGNCAVRKFKSTSRAIDLVDKNGNLKRDFNILLCAKAWPALPSPHISYVSNFEVATSGTPLKLANYGSGATWTNMNGYWSTIDSNSVTNVRAIFFANDYFEKLLKIRILDTEIEISPECFGKISVTPEPGEDIAIEPWETTYDEKLGLYIFKTAEKTTYIAPAQDVKSYISLIAEQSGGSADFNIKIIPLVKASNADAILYMGGLGGISIPLKSGFELNFNNKKTGMDYAVIEIPAGDIYQVELQLINVREDVDGTSSAELSNES